MFVISRYAILSGHDMFLSVDGIHYRHYNVFPHLHSIVTALTAYLQVDSFHFKLVHSSLILP